MMNSVSIKNFRGFGALTLEGLQRVNLVVGKNNTGKTSLLEAVAILADPELLKRLPTLFRETHGAYLQRFYRWLIRDGPTMSQAELETTGWRAGHRLILTRDSQLANQPHYEVTQATNANIYGHFPRGQKSLRSMVISTRLRNSDQLVKTFAKAVRQRDGEKQLETLLHAIDPRVNKARVDVAEDGNVIVVDFGLSEMVPLSQAGEGMGRLVSIFAELVGEQPQICFIDEVENGVHHTVLPDIWTGIAEVAERLDIQVFATTHSFECLEAAHEAFSKRANYDLDVIQLFRLEDQTSGRVLHRDLIEAGIAGNIDLR